MQTTRLPPPRPPTNGVGAPAPARPKLGRVTDATSSPPRLVINAVEGWGKTSFGAHAPNPAILMSKGESGYVTLRKAGLVPDCACVELTRWQDVLAQLDDLAGNIDGHGAIVLDALSGFERMCHESVCQRDFGGDWGEKGFGAFQRGAETSIAEWLVLLSKLDRVRTAQNVPIIILSHSKVRPFKNPMGADFDRYIADCHEKTWGVTHKWADAVLFGTYVTVALEDKKSKRMKGMGGDERVLYTTRRDAYDAKNRYAMPPQIDIPDDPASVWGLVTGFINGTAASPADEIPQ